MLCPTAVRTTEVTPSPAKSAGLPEAKTTPGVPTWPRIGVPGAWHSQQSHPLQSVNPTRILTALGFGGAGNLKSPTLRIPPRLPGGGCQCCSVTRHVRGTYALCMQQNPESISPVEHRNRAEISVVRDGNVSASRRTVDLTVFRPQIDTDRPEAPAARLYTSAYKSQIDTNHSEAPAARGGARSGRSSLVRSAHSLRSCRRHQSASRSDWLTRAALS